jgi:transcriptional regulator with XRE-family HTH domain
MSTLSDLGQQFQTLRKAAGKTQAELASAAGLRQEALSRFERGRGNDFSLVKMLRLLQALGLALEVVPVTRRPTLEAVLDERRANLNVGPDSR